MTRNNILKKICTGLLVCAMAASIAACGAKTSSKDTNNTEKSQSVSKNETNKSQDAKKQSEKTKVEPVKQDKDLTKSIKNEKEVSEGQVYVKDNNVIGVMLIKKGVSADRAKQLANEYAAKLKKQYKDKKVNVQAVQDGKNVANITK
ncbi:hypothetical protein ACFIJ5_03505 [Haloimpatiens sp. FM7330]|uniref:hypothetical protein n=1 Tax=Haloimpatiens sp. FM7330 TaxID=3298610 RepID=UPI0036411151